MLLYLKKSVKNWFLGKNYKHQFEKISRQRDLLSYNLKSEHHDNISGKRIVCLIPHADDELLGAYQFLKKYQQKNDIYLIYFQFGKKVENNLELRNEELYSFINECLTTKKIYVLNNESDIYKQFKNLIIEITPDLFLTPTFFDWHFEHRLVSKVLSQTITDLYEISLRPQVLCYSVSVPHPNNLGEIFVVKATYKSTKTKYKLFKSYYKSQQNLPKLRFEYQEKINLLLVDVNCKFKNSKEWYSAELYLRIDNFVELCLLVTNDSVITSKLDSLSSNISDMYKVRNEINNIVTSLEL